MKLSSWAGKIIGLIILAIIITVILFRVFVWGDGGHIQRDLSPVYPFDLSEYYEDDEWKEILYDEWLQAENEQQEFLYDQWIESQYGP